MNTDLPEHGVHGSIRKYQHGARDREAFRRLNEEWLTRFFHIEDRDRELFAAPERHILGPGGAIFLVDVAGEAVGCCALMPIEDGYEIAKLAVTEWYHGKGLGKLLLQACIDCAQSLGARRLFIETSSKLAPAIALYRRFGFVELPPGAAPPSDFARADVFMERRVYAEASPDPQWSARR